MQFLQATGVIGIVAFCIWALILMLGGVLATAIFLFYVLKKQVPGFLAFASMFVIGAGITAMTITPTLVVGKFVGYVAPAGWLVILHLLSSAARDGDFTLNSNFQYALMSLAYVWAFTWCGGLLIFSSLRWWLARTRLRNMP